MMHLALSQCFMCSYSLNPNNNNRVDIISISVLQQRKCRHHYWAVMVGLGWGGARDPCSEPTWHFSLLLPIQLSGSPLLTPPADLMSFGVRQQVLSPSPTPSETIVWGVHCGLLVFKQSRILKVFSLRVTASALSFKSLFPNPKLSTGSGLSPRLRLLLRSKSASGASFSGGGTAD